MPDSIRYHEPRVLTEPPPRWLSTLRTFLHRPFAASRLRRYWEEVEAIGGLAEWANQLSEADLEAALKQARDDIRLGIVWKDRTKLYPALAVLRELSDRELGIRPYDVQLLCVLAMLDRQLVQLAPGEGKTVTLAVLAVLFGWSGKPCHVVTANDYLASRDVAEMGALFRRCGLTSTAIVQDTDPADKPSAYSSDIVYSTAKQLLADYLQDMLSTGVPVSRLSLSIQSLQGGKRRLMMRGLHSLIVDEADSLLVDEATTPLIISGPESDPLLTEGVLAARAIVDGMQRGIHYQLDEEFRDVRYTGAGHALIEEITPQLPPLWRNPDRRRDILRQAIMARDFFKRDRHYVVVDDTVVIVDESTGRMMPGRSWSYGLHQAVEARAGVPLTPPNKTLAKMSFQNFFRLYHRLCGASGTLQNIAPELFHNYKVHTLVVPSRVPSRLQVNRFRSFATREQKWSALISTILERRAARQPVLIGTRSVADSERLALELDKHGLEYALLNAKNHAQEAGIVAQAGQPGRVTVATNMAGRGTDIKIDQDVAVAGGLTVIMLEPHESARVDWQLFGRAGRQGSPGLVLPFAAADDDVLIKHLPFYAVPLRYILAHGLQNDVLMSWLIRAAQRRAQGKAFRQRQRLNKLDRKAREMMSFVRGH